MVLESADPSVLWPVYKGASFELWNPDTGNYYAWAEPAHITAHLQAKREKSSRLRRSAFSEMSKEWVADPQTLPCLQPRIAFRDVARATDTRTMIAALIPPRCVLNHTAPFLVWTAGTPVDTAFLLGVLASIPLDWCVRRLVETHVTFDLLNGLPIPARRGGEGERIVEIAGRLAAPDDRFRPWAETLGVEVGPVSEAEKDALVAELDALVARAYDLDRADVEHIFETFHEGWDHSARLERVLEHFDALP
jgi:hypothetical protein